MRTGTRTSCGATNANASAWERSAAAVPLCVVLSLTLHLLLMRLLNRRKYRMVPNLRL